MPRATYRLCESGYEQEIGRRRDLPAAKHSRRPEGAAYGFGRRRVHCDLEQCAGGSGWRHEGGDYPGAWGDPYECRPKAGVDGWAPFGDSSLSINMVLMS